MLGAIIGDTVGSVYEFNNTKDVNFAMFSERSNYTDDTLMSLAVAKWLTIDRTFSHEVLEEVMVEIANMHRCPMGGYGGGFARWLFKPEYLFDLEDGTRACGRRPYNSWGNGSAMRVSAVGWMFDTLQETERVAELSASITHNHPEGIKGAQATAAAIFMARTGSSKDDIRDYIQKRFGYDLSKTWSDIHPTYSWESSCQGTVPPAIIAFLDSEDFESAIRLAVALGGDSDTLACITGGIAEAYYKYIPQEMIDETVSKLSEPLIKILESFAENSRYDVQYTSYKYSDTNEVGDVYDLARFHEAQAENYQTALAEIKAGYKRSHWIWYIFPQISGLGKSPTSIYYSITWVGEARAYLDDEILGSRLRECCEELLKHSGKNVRDILGYVDSMKLRSSMTLFDMVSPDDVFSRVLEVFFQGDRDELTLNTAELPF